ncbi:SIN3-HDAC complex-associated factor-like [Gadus macrocephalus]|uniref:SIN3-HDAC complex-associated factor-like n=1 Tax=Gadus macrocephalus TaxID=80720 RepID=UPI0028CB8180|nr:SIN3-HDAC complex-associated factor-like [Gadus macrocephalus]
MFGFHKPKMYRSLEGCCICRAKSSSSRFTHSQRYEPHLQACFSLGEVRYGDICNACVLLVKRWKKLPEGSKKNWNHVVDTKGGSSLKTALKTKRRKSRPSHHSRAEKHLKTLNSDAHSSSSTSPPPSPSYSNQSDEGSDTEARPGHAHSTAFTFLDLTYWKRRRVCCGIVYAGRYGEVIIDPQLFKPCCRKLPVEVVEQEKVEQRVEEGMDEQKVEQQKVEQQKVEQQKVEQRQKLVEQQKVEVEKKEMEEEEEEEEEGHTETARSSQCPQVQQEVSVSE